MQFFFPMTAWDCSPSSWEPFPFSSQKIFQLALLKVKNELFKFYAIISLKCDFDLFLFFVLIHSATIGNGLPPFWLVTWPAIDAGSQPKQLSGHDIVTPGSRHLAPALRFWKSTTPIFLPSPGFNIYCLNISVDRTVQTGLISPMEPDFTKNVIIILLLTGCLVIDIWCEIFVTLDKPIVTEITSHNV